MNILEIYKLARFELLSQYESNQKKKRGDF
jgi:hypothetical protein